MQEVLVDRRQLRWKSTLLRDADGPFFLITARPPPKPQSGAPVSIWLWR